jgi:hypothetical protein
MGEDLPNDQLTRQHTPAGFWNYAAGEFAWEWEKGNLR